MKEESADQLPDVKVPKSHRMRHHETRSTSKAAGAHSVESKVNNTSSRWSPEIPETSFEEESKSSHHFSDGKDKENNLCFQKNSSHLGWKEDKHGESKAIYLAESLQKSLQATGSQHYFVCPNCSKTFNNRSNFVRHLLIHREKKEFLCAICEKSFTLKQSLQAHIEKYHMKEKPFSCAECSKPFSDRSNLKRHMVTHKKKREFICDTCSKAFFLKQHLESHMWIHKDVKPFSCPHCSKALARKSHFQRHVRCCNMLKPPKSFICPTCSKPFPRKYNLERHMRTHK